MGTTGAIGPKVSSRATSASSVDAVEDGRRPVEVGGEVRRARAAGDHARAPRQGIADVLVHLGGDALVVERPHRRLGRERVAEADVGRHGAAQALDELVAHALGHEQPLAGRAALPGAQEAGADGRLRPRRRRRRRRARRAGPLPPISSSRRLPAARSAIRRPVAVEPMKPTATVPGLATSSSPTTGAGAGDEVEDAGRQVGLGHALGEQRRAHGRARRAASTRRCCRHASAGATISAGIV